jgi:hypothetical protein
MDINWTVWALILLIAFNVIGFASIHFSDNRTREVLYQILNEIKK